MSAPTGVTMRTFLFDRCLLMQATSFVLPGDTLHHRRPAASLLIADRAPFATSLEGGAPQRYQSLLLAPNVARGFIEANDSDFSLFDVGVDTPWFERIAAALPPTGARELDAQELAAVRPLLQLSFSTKLNCRDARALCEQLLGALKPQAVTAPARIHDERLRRVLDSIAANPLDQLSLPQLARVAGVSVSRLRSLFHDELGCAPTQYLRWITAWKAIGNWQPGLRLTGLIHAAGFHDLAHGNHVLNELFGVSPSRIANTRGASLNNCGG